MKIINPVPLELFKPEEINAFKIDLFNQLLIIHSFKGKKTPNPIVLPHFVRLLLTNQPCFMELEALGIIKYL